MTNSAPTTLRTLAGLPDRSDALADSTVVVVDAQREYLPSGLLALDAIEHAVDNIATILATARALGTPVIHITHQGRPGAPFDPERGGRIIEALAPSEGEPVVSKALPNSFAGTGLESVLRAEAARPLVIVGFMTHMCVSATARAALDLGFDTTVVADATATRMLPSATGAGTIDARSLHESTLAALADRFSVVVTTEQLLAAS